MKIDFNVKLMDLDGKTPMPFSKDIREPISLGLVCTTALNAMDQKNPPTPQDRYKRGKLAEKIATNDTLDLSVDELKMLKDLIGAVWGPVVVMRAWDILDPPSVEESKTK